MSATTIGSKPGRLQQKGTLGRLAFSLVVFMVFLRCSLFHEWLAYEVHFNTYLLYIVSTGAILVVLLSGSALRPFRFRTAYYWTAYAIWMVLSLPFSMWRAGSLTVILGYWQTSFVILFAVGAVISTWKECRVLFQTMALSSVAMLVFIKWFSQADEGGRLVLKFSTFANSNDYPAHLLTLLPALLWVGLVTKSKMLRIGTLGLFGYAIFVILAGESRGALLAMAVGFFYFLFTAPRKQRKFALIFGVLTIAIAFSLLSERSIHRLFSFSDPTASDSTGAMQSQEQRTQLLKDSIGFALKNPIFGLGPGNFDIAEGQSNERTWLEAHNSYAEAACECGIPALIFYLCGIGSCYALFGRVERKLRGDPSAKEFVQGAYCMRLTLVLYCTATFFLNFPYTFHLPMIAGIAIAMGYAAENWKPAAAPETVQA